MRVMHTLSGAESRSGIICRTAPSLITGGGGGHDVFSLEGAVLDVSTGRWGKINTPGRMCAGRRDRFRAPVHSPKRWKDRVLHPYTYKHTAEGKVPRPHAHLHPAVGLLPTPALRYPGQRDRFSTHVCISRRRD